MLLSKLKSLALFAAICLPTTFLEPPAQAATCTGASHYGVGDGYHGQVTASGEVFNTYALTTAHRTLPFGTRLKVTRGNKSVIVRVTDRGPFVGGRGLDLSYAAFSKLAPPSYGHIDVCYSVI